MVCVRYFDLHCDTIEECALQKVPLRRNHLNISLEKAAYLKQWAQAFACWIPDSLRGEEARRRFDLVYTTFLSQMRLNENDCAVCRSFQQMESAFSQGKAACFFTLEGSAGLGGALDALPEFKRRGVCIITLTWNGSCEAGDGCGVPDARGLTGFGRMLVRDMEALSMIVDVSHLSDRGFEDVAAQATKPFVASHSNSRAVCNHPRNLTDAQFREIVRRGGLVGLNFYPAFISASRPVSFQDMLYHVERFLSLGGEDVLAVGADFDGAVTPRNAPGGPHDGLPYDISGIDGMRAVYDFLLRFYAQPIVDKILFENAYRFFKKNLTAGESCGII